MSNVVVRISSDASRTTPIGELKLEVASTDDISLTTQAIKSSDEKIIDLEDDQLRVPHCKKCLSDQICRIISATSGKKDGNSLQNVLHELAYTIIETAGNWPNSHAHQYFVITISNMRDKVLNTYFFDDAEGKLLTEPPRTTENAEQEMIPQAATG